jgi:hypothetical protein
MHTQLLLLAIIVRRCSSITAVAAEHASCWLRNAGVHQEQLAWQNLLLTVSLHKNISGVQPFSSTVSCLPAKHIVCFSQLLAQ